MFKNILLILTLFSFLASDLSAQYLNYKLGSLLIEFSDNEDRNSVQQWIKNTNQDIQIEKVSDHFGISEIVYDHTEHRESNVKKWLWSSGKIKSIYRNSFAKLRATPDDEKFFEQWHFGTTEPGNINIQSAWDKTTGGQTKNGKEIVVAILDRSFKGNHPDLTDNIWINNLEIPDNGIDDDNNGYIDDYKGWNATDNDGDIESISDNHGTPIAGIIGAKGNNGIGIAGINWNVKMLLVSAPFNDRATIIKGYDYIVNMRKLYNETNGEKGAYIVASNSSFGFDDPFSSQYELFCNMYDSLGNQGILNVAATTNNNSNVDIVGDIPSQCSSDYLIMVTAHKEDGTLDNRGYGPINVDISAPGINIFTTNIRNNLYSNIAGGTSFATPMVVGAIALLHANSCSNLDEIVNINPSFAALWLKDKIKNNVNKSSELEAKIAWGGTLNINKTMDDLINNCLECLYPFQFQYENIAKTSVDLNWQQVQAVDSLKINIHNKDTDQTTTYYPSQNNLSLDELSPCTCYEVEYNSICGTNESSPVIDSFKTTGCCINPEGFETFGVTQSSIQLRWQKVDTAQNYNIRYRADFENEWTVIENISSTVHVVNNLSSCSSYYFEIKSNCDTELEYGNAITETTAGCGSCTALEYPESKGTPNSEYITEVNIGGNKSISENDNGYRLFDEGAYRFSACEEVPITVKFESVTNIPTTNKIGIWIDYNQDGVFDDNEEILNSDKITDSITTDILVPETAKSGLTRMRVSMVFISSETEKVSPVINYNFGEIEDYCVTIVNNNANATCPSSLDFTVFNSIDDEDLFINILNHLNFYNIILELKKENDSNFEEVNLHSNNSIRVPREAYEKCENYQFRVSAQCACSGDRISSSLQEIITPCRVSNIATNEPIIENPILYPNPNQGSFWIKNLHQFENNYNIEIYNLNGQVIYSKQNIIKNNINQKIDLPQYLTKSVYFLKIFDDKNSFNQKFILN